MCLSNVDNQIFYIKKMLCTSSYDNPPPGILFNYIKFICISLSVPVFRFLVFRCSVFRCSGVPGFTNSLFSS